MKIILCVICYLLITSSYTQASERNYIQEASAAMEKGAIIVHKNETIQADELSKRGDVNLIASLASEAVDASILRWNGCLVLSRNNVPMCIDQSLTKNAIKMKLAAAKYAIEQGNKAVAKQQYRDIIITFTGPAYASYVKQAEFGLEDLKEGDKAK